MNIEINEFKGEGYQPLVARDGWRVALVNACDRLREDRIAKLERHLETDEVFVLLHGAATLHIDREMRPCPLEPLKTYTVPKNVWHCITMEDGAAVLVIENDNTGPDNTEYIFF